ncbi:hypothetical protein EAO69_26845, partial [Streptomyces sp. me109]
MTAPRTDGVDAVRACLSLGRAVVLPDPAPLTFVITATTAHAVNRAKGRPADRPVALWTHHPRTTELVLRSLRLAPRAAESARLLLAEERVTVLAPLRHDHTPPDWPARRGGQRGPSRGRGESHGGASSGHVRTRTVSGPAGPVE